jgi:outer membrane protein, heavy metal efflux system
MKHILEVIWLVVLAMLGPVGVNSQGAANQRALAASQSADSAVTPAAVLTSESVQDSTGSTPITVVRLGDLVHEALENNPGLTSSYNTWRASQSAVPQAGALPDPTLSFNLLNMPVNSFDFDQEPMTGKQIALMQMFPFPGKLGLKTRIAEEGSSISEAKYNEARNQLVKNVKLAFYDLFFIDKAIQTTEKNTQIVSDFVRIAESKYTVGKGLQQDVLKAQVHLSKMTDKLITLKQKRVAAEAKMNALLNRPAGSSLGRPEEPAPPAVAKNLAQLKDLADKNRPLLKAWQAVLRQSEHKVRLAKKGYYPDFKIGVAYTQRDVLGNNQGGVDFLSGMFSMDLPLYFWRKQSKKVEETRYEKLTAEQNYQNVRNQVYSELDGRISELGKNERLMELYKSGIIPQATQSLNSAVAGYQTDKVDFLTMLSDEITLYDYELDYYRVLADYGKNAAELEALAGVSFKERE